MILCTSVEPMTKNIYYSKGTWIASRLNHTNLQEIQKNGPDTRQDNDLKVLIRLKSCEAIKK